MGCDCYKKRYHSEEEKRQTREAFKLMPEHMFIDLLKSFLLEGESSEKNRIKYKMIDGKIMKLENESYKEIH